jgi:hypothetical protein
MYEIIVKRIETKDVRENSWQKISDSGNPNGGGAMYGYVEHLERKDLETEVYRQKVDTLNLPDVVCVVNGILDEIVKLTTKKPEELKH